MREHRQILLVAAVAFALAILIIVRSALPGQDPWREILLNVASGLIVAVFVGILALLHEFRGVFLKNLEEVLVDQKFFEALDREKLNDIGAKAFRARISRSVTNGRHEWRQMYDAVVSEVLSLVEKEHRTGYEEHVYLEFLPRAQAATRLRIRNVPKPSDEMCLVDSVTAFRLTAPDSEHPTYHTYQYEEYLPVIQGFDAKKHGRVVIQIDDRQPERLNLSTKRQGDFIRLVGEHRFQYQGSCRVRLETKLWDPIPQYVSLRMQTLTRDFRISVFSNRPLEFHSQVFSLGGVTDPEVVRPQSIELRHVGWLLPNHGAMIYWERKEVTRGANKAISHQEKVRATAPSKSPRGNGASAPLPPRVTAPG